MDPRLLEYYNRELQFVREMGAEFAQAYPRIAARLGIDGLECADPYVERLIEGFAFLAARVQLKLDARHPDFTQHLLELVYPHFLQPTPSCAVVELAPDLKETSLLGGHLIKRGTSLRSPLVKGDRISCEFRTAHDVTLWPLTVVEAKYLSGSGALATQGIVTDGRARAAIRLRLKGAPGVKLKALPLETLTFYVKATAELSHRIFEQVVADCIGMYVRSANSQGAMVHFRPATSVRQVGLDDNEALLPVTRQGFQGYRLLQEYFAFAERFLFFSLHDLRAAMQTCDGDEMEIYLALGRAQIGLENALDASHFRLFCTPAVNLFPRSLDRVHVTDRETEYHLVPDRNRPMDFEVHSLQKMEGIGAGGESITHIRPFYSVGHGGDPREAVYYTMQRRPRQLSTRQQQSGARSTYIGSECFVSIVDAAERRRVGEIRQLDVQALCTNRDLPIQLATGQARSDFTVEGGAPVEAVRCISGPSYPRQSPGFGATAWKLISHLSLNYLSLIERTPESGAQMLRDMLALYADQNDVTALRQVEGVRTVGYETVVRRAPIEGPISYARGLEITITLDDAAFEGAGIVSLGSVLERFFARYVSLNSFTQTRLASVTRGVVKTWPVRVGCRRSI
jgi:type VI secretion system protein ImpG